MIEIFKRRKKCSYDEVIVMDDHYFSYAQASCCMFIVLLKIIKGYWDNLQENM